MAVVLAIVGALGLTATMGISVVERTREFGVMKTLGATPRRIVQMIVSEGTAIGAVSFFLALILAVPLTWFVDELVGGLGFLARLPLVFSPTAAGLWLLVVLGVAFAATLLPARQASALSVREALART